MDKACEFGVKYANLSKIENFRDLGGITIGNRRIKSDKIFRSGALFDLTDVEKADFDKLDVRHIFDFRSTDEMEERPDYVPAFATYYPMPVINEDQKSVAKRAELIEMIKNGKASDFEQLLADFVDMYRAFPFNNKAYAKMFSVMDSGDNFLFHCTAGKDRTGVASMLILLALGGDFEMAKTDYLVSNVYRKALNEMFAKMISAYVKDEKLIELISFGLSAKEEFITAAYTEIMRRYATTDEFFIKEYGADEKRRNKWIELYTESV